jgi:carbonic anhydrase/acetyltransferase-like protein (isoleucine patch superfamily)
MMMALLKPYQGQWPTVHPTAFVAETAVLIGQVTVEAHASVWYGCVLRGDSAPIHIGQGANIQDGTVIHVASQELTGQAKPTVVGAGATVGHQALLHACTIGAGAFVGMQTAVLDGAVLEPRSMLGAGSLLPAGNVVPTGTLWLGRPAKLARPLTVKDEAFMADTATHYQHLAQSHQ